MKATKIEYTLESRLVTAVDIKGNKRLARGEGIAMYVDCTVIWDDGTSTNGSADTEAKELTEVKQRTMKTAFNMAKVSKLLQQEKPANMSVLASDMYASPMTAMDIERMRMEMEMETRRAAMMGMPDPLYQSHITGISK